jgi:hypothetical protein
VFDRYVAPSDPRDAPPKLETSQQQEREELEELRPPELGIIAPSQQQSRRTLNEALVPRQLNWLLGARDRN